MSTTMTAGEAARSPREQHARAILDYVTAHPGTSRAELYNSVGLTPGRYADECVKLARDYAYEAGVCIPESVGGRGGYAVTADPEQTVQATSWMLKILMGVGRTIAQRTEWYREQAAAVEDVRSRAAFTALADAYDDTWAAFLAEVEDAEAAFAYEFATIMRHREREQRA
jgi:hypothetical protein